MKVEVVSQWYFQYIKNVIPTAVLATPVPGQDRFPPTRNSSPTVPELDSVPALKNASTSSEVTR